MHSLCNAHTIEQSEKGWRNFKKGTHFIGGDESWHTNEIVATHPSKVVKEEENANFKEESVRKKKQIRQRVSTGSESTSLVSKSFLHRHRWQSLPKARSDACVLAIEQTA